MAIQGMFLILHPSYEIFANPLANHHFPLTGSYHVFITSTPFVCVKKIRPGRVLDSATNSPVRTCRPLPFGFPSPTWQARTRYTGTPLTGHRTGTGPRRNPGLETNTGFLRDLGSTCFQASVAIPRLGSFQAHAQVSFNNYSCRHGQNFRIRHEVLRPL